MTRAQEKFARSKLFWMRAPTHTCWIVLYQMNSKCMKYIDLYIYICILSYRLRMCISFFSMLFLQTISSLEVFPLSRTFWRNAKPGTHWIVMTGVMPRFRELYLVIWQYLAQICGRLLSSLDFVACRPWFCHRLLLVRSNWRVRKLEQLTVEGLERRGTSEVCTSLEHAILYGSTLISSDET